MLIIFQLREFDRKLSLPLHLAFRTSVISKYIGERNISVSPDSNVNFIQNIILGMFENNVLLKDNNAFVNI